MSGGNNNNNNNNIICDNDQLNLIKKGFRINEMIMRDDNTGELLWKSKNWSNLFSDNNIKIELPKTVLECKRVSREMQFSSKEKLNNFRLKQIVSLLGQPIEEWSFKFGFVIPGSTNTWQCVIEAASAEEMLPASILSGNVVIDTVFYDGDTEICNSKLTVYYV